MLEPKSCIEANQSSSVMCVLQILVNADMLAAAVSASPALAAQLRAAPPPQLQAVSSSARAFLHAFLSPFTRQDV